MLSGPRRRTVGRHAALGALALGLLAGCGNRADEPTPGPTAEIATAASTVLAVTAASTSLATAGPTTPATAAATVVAVIIGTQPAPTV